MRSSLTHLQTDSFYGQLLIIRSEIYYFTTLPREHVYGALSQPIQSPFLLSVHPLPPHFNLLLSTHARSLTCYPQFTPLTHVSPPLTFQPFILMSQSDCPPLLPLNYLSSLYPLKLVKVYLFLNRCFPEESRTSENKIQFPCCPLFYRHQLTIFLPSLNYSTLYLLMFYCICDHQVDTSLLILLTVLVFYYDNIKCFLNVDIRNIFLTCHL